MTISIMAIRSLTPPTWPALARFVITVTAGVLSYATVLLIVDRQRVRDIFQLLRRGEV